MIFASVSSILGLLHVAFGASTRLPKALSRSTAPPPQPEFACTNDYDWIGDEYNRENCQAALQRLYNIDVARYGGLEYEFLPPGAENQSANPPMQTPRRYTVGQCTLAIVMMTFFPSGALPGEDPSGQYSYRDTEVTSFEALWLAAARVEVNCLVKRTLSHMVGWAPAGPSHSIGVFIWGTSSYQNRRVPPSIPPGHLAILEPSNTTSSLHAQNQPDAQLNKAHLTATWLDEPPSTRVSDVAN
ncbi:hypothetical protein N7G274_010487 [Stereocaulon virgatum]|uniref:Uncharacterized protein n=1 Tax=Stereocaulon virgatum TaxID=373712 RepID=A0ABR3ZU62_9LECA